LIYTIGDERRRVERRTEAFKKLATETQLVLSGFAADVNYFLRFLHVFAWGKSTGFAGENQLLQMHSTD
jgi:hypothetical protein